MGCTRNRLKILGRVLTALAIWVSFIPEARLWAAFASQFSLGVGEAYSDNIFFSKDKEHDFISLVRPTLTFLYAPAGQVVPTLNVNLSTRGEIYARNSDLNNFGDNVLLNAGYTYQYSPRLTFHLADSFRRQGETRLGGYEFGQFPSGPTSPLPPGGVPNNQNLDDLISAGEQITNSVSFQASYLYRESIRFTGGYDNFYTRYLDAGGSDVYHTLRSRAIYNWQREHNLYAGYSISFYSPRDGDRAVIHNFDVGDDYFTNYNLQLTPTLALSASTGISLNTSNDGPRVANNSTVTITKLWETATLAGGLRKGLTPSFGVAGISDTTSFFTNFNYRLSEKFSTNANADFSFYDTDDVNFKTFQSSLGLQYLFTSWLSADLIYFFNWRDSGSGADSTDLLDKGIVRSNNVILSLTFRFDLWPNTGLARSITASSLSPVLRTPFPYQGSNRSIPVP